MKYGIVVFPGSNCDRDMQDALQNSLNKEVIMLWHKDKDMSMLSSNDCVVLPGGFSYGDYLRCGAIARFSPMMQRVIAFANNGGRVLGVCNGFQILCESGLLPGVLLKNLNQQFICKNILLKAAGRVNDVGPLSIPIAHGDGRFYAGEALLDEMEQNDQVIFKYCDQKGDVRIDACPNGAARNIAGICNKQQNVFGMMPHPERAADKSLANTDGLKVFEVLGLN